MRKCDKEFAQSVRKSTSTRQIFLPFSSLGFLASGPSSIPPLADMARTDKEGFNRVNQRSPSSMPRVCTPSRSGAVFQEGCSGWIDREGANASLASTLAGWLARGRAGLLARRSLLLRTGTEGKDWAERRHARTHALTTQRSSDRPTDHGKIRSESEVFEARYRRNAVTDLEKSLYHSGPSGSDLSVCLYAPRADGRPLGENPGTFSPGSETFGGVASAGTLGARIGVESGSEAGRRGLPVWVGPRGASGPLWV